MEETQRTIEETVKETQRKSEGTVHENQRNMLVELKEKKWQAKRL